MQGTEIPPVHPVSDDPGVQRPSSISHAWAAVRYFHLLVSGVAHSLEEEVMGKEPMDRESADRISAAAERDPDSPTAQSGFDERAEAAADRNESDDD